MHYRTRLIVGVIAGLVLLALAFYLGYLSGRQSFDMSPRSTPSLTSRDMEHAFGSMQTPELESISPPPAASSLSGLVAGLEKKVAANPENIDQQLLLAQTYNELDNRPKGINLLRSLNKKTSRHPQVKITLATMLMVGANKQELNEAFQLFEEAIQLSPEVSKMARLYQSEIKVKLGKPNS